eukprot:1671735-Rhodomonas_salina.1
MKLRLRSTSWRLRDSSRSEAIARAPLSPRQLFWMWTEVNARHLPSVRANSHAPSTPILLPLTLICESCLQVESLAASQRAPASRMKLSLSFNEDSALWLEPQLAISPGDARAGAQVWESTPCNAFGEVLHAARAELTVAHVKLRQFRKLWEPHAHEFSSLTRDPVPIHAQTGQFRAHRQRIDQGPDAFSLEMVPDHAQMLEPRALAEPFSKR